jgi:aspartate-semialdehyde dehydrogenase
MTAQFTSLHRHTSLDRLSDRRLLRELGYIDGAWVAGAASASFEVTDPGSGDSLAWVAALDAGQAEEAIDAAARAFPLWRASLPQERSRLLRNWFDLIVAAKEDLALLMTLNRASRSMNRVARSTMPPPSSNGMRRKQSDSMSRVSPVTCPAPR